MVLRGTAENIMKDAPAGWNLYFMNDVENVSCLTKDLPVTVTELKHGSRKNAVEEFGPSLIEALESMPEKWLLYVQEDTAFPDKVSPELLQRIVGFAEEQDALFIDLSRNNRNLNRYMSVEQLKQDGLNVTFERHGPPGAGQRFVVNHNLALSNKAWFLERARRAIAVNLTGVPGSVLSNELLQDQTPEQQNRMFFTNYTGEIVHMQCDHKRAILNQWGCRVEPKDPSKLNGLDASTAIAHKGVPEHRHQPGRWHRDYTRMGIRTLKQLGLRIDGPMDGFQNASEPWCKS